MCRLGAKGHHAALYCQICKKVGQKVSHAARELATVVPVTFLVSSNSWSNGQAPPPQRKVSRHITGGELVPPFQCPVMLIARACWELIHSLCI